MRLNLLFSLTTLFLIACNTSGEKHDHDRPEILSGYADSVNKGLIVNDTMKRSVRRLATAAIGQTDMKIIYHSPGVKGRIIWGGLVPYNTVWVTGAHSATSLEINNPIKINDQLIAAGTYAIFTIPGEKEWQFILNKNHQQHLADDYSEKEDIFRIPVIPSENNMVQRLTYKINKTGDKSGNISIEWERIKIEVPFVVEL